MFCALVLAEDAKNYHVWAHRQHVVRACGLWDQELAFTATAIAADVRNNSAWNQRMFCLLGEAQAGQLQPDVTDRELAFARVYLLCAPNNEAPWAFVGGLAAHAQTEVPGREAALACDGRYQALAEEVCGVCWGCRPITLPQALALDPYCVYAHALLADVYEAQSSLLHAAGDVARAADARAHAVGVLEALQRLDPLRRGYWQTRSKRV